MKMLPTIRSLTLGLAACLSALVISAPVYAQHGGGGGGHGGGGAHGYSGGGHAGGYGGYRGGYGGYRGGYGGYRGGYGYGYRGGYGYYRGGYGWGGWGWGGLGLGLYFATLPYYYSTYWWGGVPYYYADDTYYRWDDASRQYQTVAPPAEVASQAAGDGGAVSELMVYPKNGQSQDQQGKDKFECHRWAAEQSGFDPSLGSPAAGGGGTAMTSNPGKRSDYFRAQAACLEGRGYSVK